MTQPRVRAILLVLRATLFAFFAFTAAPATPFVSFAADLSGAQARSFEDAGDLGLGIGPLHSGDETLFTFFYNATTYGEMQPCPT